MITTSHLQVIPMIGEKLLIHPTGIQRDWLTHEPRTAALLWLVVKAFHNPLPAQLKIDLLIHPMRCISHISWQLFLPSVASFLPLQDWSEEYPDISRRILTCTNTGKYVYSR